MQTFPISGPSASLLCPLFCCNWSSFISTVLYNTSTQIINPQEKLFMNSWRRCDWYLCTERPVMSLFCSVYRCWWSRICTGKSCRNQNPSRSPCLSWSPGGTIRDLQTSSSGSSSKIFHSIFHKENKKRGDGYQLLLHGRDVLRAAIDQSGVVLAEQDGVEDLLTCRDTAGSSPGGLMEMCTRSAALQSDPCVDAEFLVGFLWMLFFL